MFITEDVRVLVDVSEKLKKQFRIKEDSYLELKDNKLIVQQEKYACWIDTDEVLDDFVTDIVSFNKMLNLWKKDNLNLIKRNRDFFLINGKKEKTLSCPIIEEKSYDKIDMENVIDITCIYDSYLRAIEYTSDDESRQFMAGVLIDTESNVVATDGKRMYFKNMNTKFPIINHRSLCNNTGQITIKPFNYFKTVNKIVTNGLYTIFTYQGVNVAIKNIQGAFPNFKRVIPEYSHSKSFNCKEITESLKEIIKIKKIDNMDIEGVYLYPGKIEIIKTNKDYSIDTMYTDHIETFWEDRENEDYIIMDEHFLVDMNKTLGDKVNISILNRKSPIKFFNDKENVLIMGMQLGY